MSVTEIKEKLTRLTNAERLALMDWIWESLDNKDKEVESPAWHGAVLAEREAKIRSGDAEFLSLDEVKKRLHH